MAAQTYTTTQPVTLAQLAAAYEVLSTLFAHLAAAKRQQNLNIIVSALILNGDNTVSITFTQPLPLGADQLLHLGIA